MSATTSLLLLKQADASKTGQRAEGKIGYVVLADGPKSDLFIKLTRNDGGGYFSNETVPIDKIEACLAGTKPDAPFPSKVFAPAFAGRSSNNAGFLAAVLRAEGLISASPEAVHQHKRAGDIATWKKAMLALPGKPYADPAKAAEAAVDPKKAAPAKTDAPARAKAVAAPQTPKAS